MIHSSYIIMVLYNFHTNSHNYSFRPDENMKVPAILRETELAEESTK